MEIQENLIKILGRRFHFSNSTILDIGCGTGRRTVQYAACSGTHVYAIDPVRKNIQLAKREHSRDNISYMQAPAEKLPFKSGFFHHVCFTLSLHHIGNRKKALAEAKRVVRRGGLVIVIEPGFHGSLFESEILFDCFDGDERRQKAQAYADLLTWNGLPEIEELWDETAWKFQNIGEFRKMMHPKKSLKSLNRFLKKHKITLRAERRINIF